MLERYSAFEVPQRMLDAITKRDVTIAGQPVRTYSFADFLAYQFLVAHLPALCRAVKAACKAKKGPIDKEDFKVAARTYLGPRLSRVEAEAMFEVNSAICVLELLSP